MREYSMLLHDRVRYGAQFTLFADYFLYHQFSLQALKMIHNIREAFNELLDQNEWMDEETKKVAKEKADAMNERIGYSDSLTNHVEVSKEYEEVFLYCQK